MWQHDEKHLVPLFAEAALAPTEVEKHEDPDADESVREHREEVVGSLVPFDHSLADVPIGGAEHEQRPAEAGREPEQAAEAPSCSPTSNWHGLPVGQPIDSAASSGTNTWGMKPIGKPMTPTPNTRA